MDELEIVARRAPFDYSEGFYQKVHLATLAGINRAAANEAATLVANRKRRAGATGDRADARTAWTANSSRPADPIFLFI